MTDLQELNNTEYIRKAFQLSATKQSILNTDDSKLNEELKALKKTIKQEREQTAKIVNKLLDQIERFIESFETETQILEWAKDYISNELTSAEASTDFANDDGIIDYDSVAYTFSISLPLRYLREAVYRKNWNKQNLLDTIAETINEFYPSVIKPSFIFYDEKDGKEARISFDRKEKQLHNLDIYGNNTAESGEQPTEFIEAEEVTSTQSNQQLSFGFDDEEIIEPKEWENYISAQIKDSNYYYQKDPITRRLTTFDFWLLDEETKELAIARNEVDVASERDKKKGNSIIDYVVLSNESKKELASRLTKFEVQVLQAIFCEWENKVEITTALRLFRIIRKNPSIREVPKDIEEKIFNALRVLRTTNILVDARNEALYYPSFENFANEGIMVNTEIKWGLYNGKPTRLIKIIALSEAPLYKYVKDKEQIGCVNFKYLSANTINKTEEISLFEEFLIDLIDRKGESSTSFYLSSIFNYAEIKDYEHMSREKKKRKVDNIKRLLDGYVETDFIKSYEPKKSGNTTIGFKIHKNAR